MSHQSPKRKPYLTIGPSKSMNSPSSSNKISPASTPRYRTSSNIRSNSTLHSQKHRIRKASITRTWYCCCKTKLPTSQQISRTPSRYGRRTSKRAGHGQRTLSAAYLQDRHTSTIRGQSHHFTRRVLVRNRIEPRSPRQTTCLHSSPQTSHISQ